MDSGGFAALGFWIFVAAIIVASIWQETQQKAQKHETLRRIMEKTGTIDEAQLQALFGRAQSGECRPGGLYRGLRILGTIVMFAGAGIFTFFLVAAGLALLFGRMEELSNVDAVFAVFAIPAGIAMAGYGLFFASRFAEPPLNNRIDPAER